MVAKGEICTYREVCVLPVSYTSTFAQDIQRCSNMEKKVFLGFLGTLIYSFNQEVIVIDYFPEELPYILKLFPVSIPFCIIVSASSFMS